MRKTLIGLLLLALSPLATAATDELVTIERIVAVVNDDVITHTELDRAVTLIQDQLRARNVTMPPLPVLRKQVLEREVVKKLQLQMAKNTWIIVDDNTLNNAIDNIAAQNNMSLRELRDVLESDGYDFAEYRENLREEIIISRLQQREVQSRVTVTEQEIDNFLATQFAQGNVDDEFRLAHILVSVPEAASAGQIQAAQQKAETVLAELRGGADFGKTAISLSDGQQALDGGDLGWRKAGELPTLFVDEVRHLDVNEISNLIRSPSGFHIIKLLNKRAGERHVVEQTRARHILVRPNALLSEQEAISKLRHLKERIENGENFETLARSHSEDRASAAKGGDLGWVSPGDMVPRFEQVMNSLDEGRISEPFQTQFGWHIVQVMEHRKLDNSDEYRRNKAREFLLQRKTQENLETWLRQIRDQAYVDFRLDRHAG